jgi:hypothetical protein
VWDRAVEVLEVAVRAGADEAAVEDAIQQVWISLKLESLASRMVIMKWTHPDADRL